MQPSDGQIFYDYIMKMIGIPYKWGGNNPVEGLDCSGFVCEALRSQGFVAYNEDLSAQEIYERLIKVGKSNEMGLGTILFFGHSLTSLTHVTIALSDQTMIEAGGGDPQTLTLKDSIDRNAFIKVSPISRRKDLMATVKPNYHWLS